MEKLSTKRKLLLTVQRIADLLEQLVDQKSPEVNPYGEGPEHVTVDWIADFLQIHKSNFYRNVNHKLIKPVLYIGKRPYYLRQDVHKLLRPHEKGAHTFSKLKRAKSPK